MQVGAVGGAVRCGAVWCSWWAVVDAALLKQVRYAGCISCLGAVPCGPSREEREEAVLDERSACSVSGKLARWLAGWQMLARQTPNRTCTGSGGTPHS